MKRHRLPIALAIIGIVLAGLAGAQSIDRDRAPFDPVDDDRGPEHTITPGLPAPIYPSVLPSMSTADYQLVGFTLATFTGDCGVLNYSLQCGIEFPGSRMCTEMEIRRTTHVPRAPGSGQAWVESVDSRADCQSWTSDDAADTGLAITLGEHGCYGGFRAVDCGQPLAVACCGSPS